MGNKTVEGQRLREEVDRYGGTTALARALGVDPSLFYKYMSGSTRIGVDLEEKLQKAGIDMDYIRSGERRERKTGQLRDATNISRLFIDETTAYDTLQPILRQRVHAGPGTPILDETAELFNISKHYKGTISVEITGDSMIDAGLKAKDRVVIRIGKRPQNGSIVLASLNGEFILKAFEQDEFGRVFLIPANDDYETIMVTPEDQFEVIGVMDEFIRKQDDEWFKKRKR